jgi:hypothetical protein
VLKDVTRNVDDDDDDCRVIAIIFSLYGYGSIPKPYPESAE